MSDISQMFVNAVTQMGSTLFSFYRGESDEEGTIGSRNAVFVLIQLQKFR